MTHDRQAEMLEPCSSCGALPCDHVNSQPESYCRPEVMAFAVLMERQLRANDHKPGWKQDSPEALIERVSQEAGELRTAVDRLRRIVWVPYDGSGGGGWRRNNPQTGAPEMGAGYEDVPEPQRTERAAAIASEAADVANMAMMVADVCGCLEALSAWNARAEGVGVEEIRTEAAANIVDVWMGGNKDWRARLGGSDFLESADWLAALQLTDAVLSAMREPTEAQIRAVDAALHEHWPNARKMAVAVHHAIIDAALQQGTSHDG